MGDMVVVRKEGLYCVPGQFYIDPWRPVDRAVITHAHGDHARWGHQHYLASNESVGILKSRLGHDIRIDGLAYGERIVHNGVTISLHPAGHVLGSAQVRMEHEGEIWVASGDYKVEPDATCAPFEAVRCHTFITESTFGLPIYRWPRHADVFDDMNRWWQANAAAGDASMVGAYSLGKTQHVLAGIEASIGPVYVHPAAEAINAAHVAEGVALPATRPWSDLQDARSLRGALIVAPPSASPPWRWQRAVRVRESFASGWMQQHGARHRAGLDRGFVLSDHADWPGLLAAVDATRCTRVIVTHGDEAVLLRALADKGLECGTFRTSFGDAM